MIYVLFQNYIIYIAKHLLKTVNDDIKLSKKLFLFFNGTCPLHVYHPHCRIFQEPLTIR